MPFLGQDDLYRQYRFDQPWDGPHNRALTTKIPEVYACAASKRRNLGVTTYLAIVGRATAWPAPYCTKIEDFQDGTSNTILLVESTDSDIAWLEPRDMTHQQAMRFERPGAPLRPTSAGHGRDAFFALLGDGAVRSINMRISRDVFRSLLSIHGGAPFPGVDWPLDEIPVMPQLPNPRPQSAYPGTDVQPQPAVPLVAGRNCVYCATFEIAWDQASQQCGGRPLRLAGDPPLARGLNAHQFPLSNLSPECYVVGAGHGNEEFRSRLADEVQRKFPGATPALINPDGMNHALQLYAYLLKQLPFRVAFDDLPNPLLFVGGSEQRRVASFGARLLDEDSRSEQLQSQITILDYVSDDDFVLSLKPGTPRDVIVLAKIAPAATLEEAINTVRRRIEHPDPQHTDRHFLATESLAIPKLTISVKRDYSEIVGEDKAIHGTDLYISGALQIIKFRIDEIGAVLESEAVVVADNGHSPRIPAGHRKFIFDRPFLIYLIERDAEQPYFAAWIENAELMDAFAK